MRPIQYEECMVRTDGPHSIGVCDKYTHPSYEGSADFEPILW